jgi:hypothetical protein
MDASKNTNYNMPAMLAHSINLDSLIREEKFELHRAGRTVSVGAFFSPIPKLKGLLFKYFIVPRLNFLLKKIIKSSQRAIVDLENYKSADVEVLAEVYDDSKSMLGNVKEMYYMLEKVEFFYNGITRKHVEDLLALEYKFNSKAKSLYYSKVGQENDPSDLKMYDIADKLTKSLVLHERIQ